MAMDFKFDDSSDHTSAATLKYGKQESEMVHKQIMTHSIALVFNYCYPLLFGCRGVMDTVFTFLMNMETLKCLAEYTVRL